MPCRPLLPLRRWPPWNSWRKSSELTDAERAWFLGFSAIDVHCTKPADRATVLHEMRREWGDPNLPAADRERSMKGIEEFNKFVQETLPDVLKESKARYSELVGRAASEAIELAVGSQ